MEEPPLSQPQSTERGAAGTESEGDVDEPRLDEAPAFPKSVVKTTRGKVIGEYYYDPKMYKNQRHYIYNSEFFCTKVGKAVAVLRNRFDQELFGETRQMVEDAYKRVAANQSLHFEVSTNEILNDAGLKQLLDDMKLRRFDDCAKLCTRLRAKISAMGTNYRVLLQEQMARYGESR